MQRGDLGRLDGEIAAGGSDDPRGLAQQVVDGGSPTGSIPSVAVVMVAHNPGAWFEEAVRSLLSQDYPSLGLIVVDSGSNEDLSHRIVAAAPQAIVIRSTTNIGWAASVNRGAAAARAAGALFVVACHDDVALEQSAVRVMVEEAFRSNAAIVGPKVVDWDRAEQLLEVGLDVDRFGVVSTGLEPGEVDQEQHDAVRDVFAVSGVAMLIRTDLLEALDGFDPEQIHDVSDVDGCWRARLLGARVVVAPDAVARHRRASVERALVHRPDRRESAGAIRRRRRVLGLRSRARMVAKVSSRASLAIVVPEGLVLTALMVVRHALVGRLSEARAWIRAWTWNLRHLPSLRRARRTVQRSRRLNDREIRSQQLRVSTRVRTELVNRFDGERRARELALAGRNVVDAASSGVRQPVFAVGAAFVLVVLAGSRVLIRSRVPTVGSFLPWTSARDLWGAFLSGWRFSGLGSDGAAPPAFAVMGLLSTVLLGSAALARTLVIVSAIPLAAFGMFRMTRSLAANAWPALTAAIVYGALPVPRNAIAQGRLGPLVLYALAPFILLRVLRAAGGAIFDTSSASPAARGSEPTSPSPSPARGASVGRSAISLALLTALAGAFYPPALLVPALASVVLVVCGLAFGGLRSSLQSAAAAALGVGGSFLLLLPWSWHWFFSNPDGAQLGFVFSPRLDLRHALTFDSGPAAGGAWMWPLFVVAALPIALGHEWRLRWSARAWLLMAAGFGLAWLPNENVFQVAFPTSEAPLTIAALGLGLGVGLATAVFIDEIRRQVFSWRQTIGVAAMVAIGIAALPFVGAVGSGRWELPKNDWSHRLAWMAPQATDDGPFRVLWLGRPEVLPLDPSLMVGHLGYGVTRNGTGDARDLWPAAIGDESSPIEVALRVALDRRTNRLGHLLAPLAVRYLAFPQTDAPRSDSSDRGSTSGLGLGAAGDRSTTVGGSLGAALAEQTDLTRLAVHPDLILYVNDAWTPDGSVQPADRADAFAAPNLLAAVGVDLTQPDGDRILGSGQRRLGTVGPGIALLGERYDDDWKATQASDGSDAIAVPHRAAFGTVNQYALRGDGKLEVRYRGQNGRRLTVLFELALLVIAIWLLRRQIARDDENSGPEIDLRERTVPRRVSTRRSGPIDADALDEFWEVEPSPAAVAKISARSDERP